MALGSAACRNEPHPAPAGPGSGAAAPASAEAPPRPASPAELAIVAPAVAGSPLGDFTIAEIQGTARGLIEVTCEKGRARVVLSIALAAEGGPAAPASAGRYAVFYSLRDAQPEDGERLAAALAKILEANRAVPPPPGLLPFVPRPVSL
jgi:hypothetical protein